MPVPADAIVLVLDSGASTVAWARDVLPSAEVDAALGRGLVATANSVGGDAGADGAVGSAMPSRSSEPTAPPPNPRVFDVLRSAAMRLVATRFCYFSKQDRMGALVLLACEEPGILVAILFVDTVRWQLIVSLALTGGLVWEVFCGWSWFSWTPLPW